MTSLNALFLVNLALRFIKMKRFRITFLLVALLLGAASCKPKNNYVYLSTPNSQPEITEYEYVGSQIKTDDVLLILVSALDEVAVSPFNLGTMSKTNSESKTSQIATPSEYLVNAEGYINFPVLGEILVKGKTHQELRRDLELRLKEYLTDPLVSLSLKNFNISVLGEVKSPGQKSSVTQKINVFQALALAGDMNEYGDRTRVKLIRSREGAADEVINLNLADRAITSSPYYYLQQNDILYVEPDTNKQIAANSNPNRSLWFQIGGAALGIISLIIGLTR